VKIFSPRVWFGVVIGLGFNAPNVLAGFDPPVLQNKDFLNVTGTDFGSVTSQASYSRIAAGAGGQFIVSSTFVQPAGTGNIDPFLRIQQTGSERGYNTGGAAPLDTKDGNGNDWNAALQLKAIPLITIGGVQYRQFLLDVDQSGNGPISLNQIQIFQSSAALAANAYSLPPNQEASQGTGANGTGGRDAVISFAGLNPVFQMNLASNNGVDLSQNMEIWIDSGHGNGTGDMFLYVQNDAFGANADDYITLFSQFGRPNGSFSSNSSFEEWAVRTVDTPTGGGHGGGGSTPAPAGLVLIASAVPMMAFRRVFRRKMAGN